MSSFKAKYFTDCFALGRLRLSVASQDRPPFFSDTKDPQTLRRSMCFGFITDFEVNCACYQHPRVICSLRAADSHHKEMGETGEGKGVIIIDVVTTCELFMHATDRKKDCAAQQTIDMKSGNMESPHPPGGSVFFQMAINHNVCTA